MSNEERVEQFKDRWAEADEKGMEGHRVEYALAPLLEALTKADAALDYIATRVTDDDYDNPSSALEAIGDAVTGTGREIDNG